MFIFYKDFLYILCLDSYAIIALQWLILVFVESLEKSQ